MALGVPGELIKAPFTGRKKTSEKKVYCCIAQDSTCKAKINLFISAVRLRNILLEKTFHVNLKVISAITYQERRSAAQDTLTSNAYSVVVEPYYPQA